MDMTTLAAYNADAAGFAKEWNEQAAPSDMHQSFIGKNNSARGHSQIVILMSCKHGAM
jgi:hypothetical protein